MPILNKTIIILLFVLFILVIIKYNKTETFTTTSSINNILESLSVTINNPKYANIDIDTKEGVYYNLNPGLVNDINSPVYKLYLNKPSNDDIKHYKNGDISQLEKNSKDLYLYNLIIKNRDNTLNSKYINPNTYNLFEFRKILSGNEERIYFLRVYRELYDNYFLRTVVRLSSRTKKIAIENNKILLFFSEQVDITSIINSIKNYIIDFNMFNLNNIIKERYTISINVYNFNILFELNDKLLNKQILSNQINNLKNKVNNFKNLANIYLNAVNISGQGIFNFINFDFKIKSITSRKIVYSLFIVDITPKDIFRIQYQGKQNLAIGLLFDDKEIIVNDIKILFPEFATAIINSVLRASYTFYSKNNKYYFRRNLPYIDGPRKTFDKKCDITIELQNFFTNFQTILPPIENTTTDIDVLEREILYNINLPS